MSKINTYRDLLVWQRAHELVMKTYKATKSYPDDEKYNIISQMRRAVLSVALNIVEGFRRKGVKDSINFYNISDSSLEELKYLIFLSFELNYISEQIFIELNNKAEEVSKMLFSWIYSQKKNKNLI